MLPATATSSSSPTQARKKKPRKDSGKATPDAHKEEVNETLLNHVAIPDASEINEEL